MFDRGKTLRLAARHAEVGKVHEALREYRRLIEADPAEVAALHEAIAIHLREGADEEAARALALLGERLAVRGWRLAAILRFRRALELSSTLPAEARAPFRAVSRAVEQLRGQVSEQRAALSACDERALAAEKQGRDVQVIELLLQMIGLQPDNPVFHARLAETFCRVGREADAIPSFRLAAALLVELDRKTDALRVLERLLHFQADVDDAKLAARIHLDRAEASDAMRAVAKLQVCIAKDPEDLDALGLLARAFVAMQQEGRATRVEIEMARIASEAGELELTRELLSVLERTAPADPIVRSLSGRERSLGASAPSLSGRSTFLSVTGEDPALDEVLAESRDQGENSVLEELSFEELSEVWVMPVITREARRALDDAGAFLALRLYPKAEYVLRSAVEQDPVCAELREALREVVRSQGKMEAFVAETIALADLYRQRRFYGRAWTLVDEALGAAPGSEVARSFSEGLPERPSEPPRVSN